MFGMSMKERASEALHRGTKAVLIGGYFDVDHAKEFGINEEASAWMYTEAIAHQIYALTVIANNTITKQHRWATPEFIIKSINEAINNFEMEEEQPPGTISSFVFRRCAEIDQLTPQQRTDGEQFWQSAAKIRELDQRANEADIAEKLASVTQEYFHAAFKMFN